MKVPQEICNVLSLFQNSPELHRCVNQFQLNSLIDYTKGQLTIKDQTYYIKCTYIGNNLFRVWLEKIKYNENST